jgi:phenylalanyl-tRNA synthetase beta chain
MRHTLLAGVLEIAASNARNTDRLRLFEVGPVYLPRAGEKLPDEPRRLAMVLAGPRQSEFWGQPVGGQPELLDFYDAKGVVDLLLADLHVVEAAYESATSPYLHPGRAAQLVVQGKLVGSFGQLHPTTARAFDLAGLPQVLVGEFDLEALLTLVPARYAYTPVARFPAALRDIAVIVDESLPGARVEAEIRAAGGDLLQRARLFDLYRGESIAAGKKSLAYALIYQSSDRTLTDKEVDKAHKKIEDRLRHVLKAQIRGKD